MKPPINSGGGGGEMAVVASTGGEGVATLASPMQGLLQQIQLQDGSIAYMPHPASGMCQEYT